MAKIITTPNPILREVSKPIRKLDKKTLKIIRDVQETLTGGENPKGVGLSAVQIGKPIRAFATYLPPSGNPDDEKQKPILKTFINPEIIETSKEKTLGEIITRKKLSDGKPYPKIENENAKPVLEGCLSIPGIWGPVHRHTWIKLKYFTLDAKRLTLTERSERYTDFPARVIQHELDHLNGILFTDHSLSDHLPLYESRNEELVKIDLS